MEKEEFEKAREKAEEKKKAESVKKTEVEEIPNASRAASASPEDDSRHLTPHASKSHKVTYRCRMVKSSTSTRTLNDERKHSIKEEIRESLNPMPNSIPEESEDEGEESDDETEVGNNNQTTASIGRQSINLFTSFQCKEKRSGLIPYEEVGDEKQKRWVGEVPLLDESDRHLCLQSGTMMVSQRFQC